MRWAALGPESRFQVLATLALFTLLALVCAGTF